MSYQPKYIPSLPASPVGKYIPVAPGSGVNSPGRYIPQMVLPSGSGIQTPRSGMNSPGRYIPSPSVAVAASLTAPRSTSFTPQRSTATTPRYIPAYTSISQPISRPGSVPQSWPTSCSSSGVSTPYDPNVDPWIVKDKDIPKVDLRLLGMTPLGTLSHIPTAQQVQPIPSPRRTVPRYALQKEDMPGVDPLLETTIILDCTKQTDEDYNYIATRMREIRTSRMSLHQQYKTEWIAPPSYYGRVDQATFDRLLGIYENNQVWYQDRMDDYGLTREQIALGLTQLEHWFLAIIEPRQTDDLIGWRQRELGKIHTGISGYCDPTLVGWISKPTIDLINYIQGQQYGYVN